MSHSCQAQLFRLNRWKYLTDISTDLNDYFNYNIYEGTRWGAGLVITTPLHYNKDYDRDQQNALRFRINGAYGTSDNAFKFGGSVALMLPRANPTEWHVAYRHDVERAGQRSLSNYDLLRTSDNASYVSSHYSGIDRVSLGLSNLKLKQQHRADLELRASREQYLFSGFALFRPALGEPALPAVLFAEGHLRAYRGSWTFDLLAGERFANPDCVSDASLDEALDGLLDARPFARALLQRSTVSEVGMRKNKLRTFAQLGLSSPGTPYGRMFDLSGTGGSYYFFRNSFMTVRPNTFMANNFLQACVCYTVTKPLWNLKISNPRLFAQANAVWGISYGETVNNQYYFYSLTHEKIAPVTLDELGNLGGLDPQTMVYFQSPNHGLFEIAAGVDRLIRWGWINLGCSVAYQMTPSSAAYHQSGFTNNFALMGVATLIYED